MATSQLCAGDKIAKCVCSCYPKYIYVLLQETFGMNPGMFHSSHYQFLASHCGGLGSNPRQSTLDLCWTSHIFSNYFGILINYHSTNTIYSITYYSRDRQWIHQRSQLHTSATSSHHEFDTTNTSCINKSGRMDYNFGMIPRSWE